ncbi:MAG: hypothetical protein DWH79_04975 [Planctomycetota bacterium]|nr:MAG: hypothetical protein DWH79_04975 [Planctomycetota bacterium]
MLFDALLLLAGLLAMGIETAYVPTEGGGGDYLVRVEPDLVRGETPYTLTSDVPADSRDVRRVMIYVADAWPPAVERTVSEAAKRPRVAPTSAVAPLAATTLPLAATRPIITAAAGGDKPWPLLIGSLLTLFLSLGANAYLGLLLASMRQRYLRDIQPAAVIRG